MTDTVSIVLTMFVMALSSSPEQLHQLPQSTPFTCTNSSHPKQSNTTDVQEKIHSWKYNHSEQYFHCHIPN